MSKTNYSPAQRAAMRHNSLIGLAVAIQRNAEIILTAATTTNEARIVADAIQLQAKDLEKALRAGRKS